MTFRSFCEFEFYIICILLKLDIKYEPNDYCVKWFNEPHNFYSTYLPDFYIDNIGLIELKHTKYAAQAAIRELKYQSVKTIYQQMDIEYRITYIEEFCKTLDVEYDYQIKNRVKLYIKDLIFGNNIRIITPYRHARVLKNLFDTDDLSTINCITFTTKHNYNLYGEL